MPDIPTTSEIEALLFTYQHAEPPDLRACEMIQVIHQKRHRGAFYVVGFMTARAQMPLGFTMGTTDHAGQSIMEFEVYLDDMMEAFSRYGHKPQSTWSSYHGNPDWFMRVYHKATEDEEREYVDA